MRRAELFMDCARHLGEQALRAVLHEAAVTRKPGLVCPDSTGAHDDMDIQTFITSAVALHPFFRSAAVFGLTRAECSPEEVFVHLRELGKRAEKRMLQATRGVNTHKGLIFSLGLLCAGAGRVWAKQMAMSPEKERTWGRPPDAASIARTAAEFVRGLTERELMPLAMPVLPHCELYDLTAGERFFRSTGGCGVRGEVASGFPHALQAVAWLRDSRGLGWNTSALLALLYLMSEVEDSVVWNRGGWSGVALLRRGAMRVLGFPPESTAWDAALSELEHTCILYRLSPGGCADLLASAFFLRFVEDETDETVEPDERSLPEQNNSGLVASVCRLGAS